jgi:hypothetical protein
MSNLNEQLNDEQNESPFSQLENEHDFEAKAKFLSHAITGGKGPGLVSENENE